MQPSKLSVRRSNKFLRAAPATKEIDRPLHGTQVVAKGRRVGNVAVVFGKRSVGTLGMAGITYAALTPTIGRRCRTAMDMTASTRTGRLKVDDPYFAAVLEQRLYIHALYVAYEKRETNNIV